MASQAAPFTASPATVPTSLPRAALALANVKYEKKGSIAYVTVNRPKVLNALNTPTWTDLQAAFEDAKADKSVHGVILTGAGDKAFIAGADISELAHVDAYEAEESSRFGQGVLDLVENLGKPVIAAINGFALGGGCETAMACTMRIAAEHAKFGQPEVKLGLLPGGGGTQRLPRLVGKGSCVAADPHGRDDFRAGGLSHRPRQRNRPRGQPDRAGRGDPEADRGQRADRREVLARSGEQGAGYQPKRGPCPGSLLLRHLRRDRRQEGRHLCLPRETRAAVSGPVNSESERDRTLAMATPSPTAIPTERFRLTSSDGLCIACARWGSRGAARAVVQIAHGMGEHMGRYADTVDALVAAGLTVYANDHRGHGLSVHSQVGTIGQGRL